MTVSGEVQNGHHDKCQVDPKIVAKDDNEDASVAVSVFYLQGTPTGATMGGIAKAIWEEGREEGQRKRG